MFIEEENKRTTGDERDGGRRGREGDLEGNVEVDVKGKCGEEKIEAREEKGGLCVKKERIRGRGKNREIEKGEKAGERLREWSRMIETKKKNSLRENIFIFSSTLTISGGKIHGLFTINSIAIHVCSL